MMQRKPRLRTCFWSLISTTFRLWQVQSLGAGEIDVATFAGTYSWRGILLVCRRGTLDLFLG
jgi:hypothetical protein